MLKPTEPVRWLRFVREAYGRGRATPSLACVVDEASLPPPLAEARRQIGVPELHGVHPGGILRKGDLLHEIERRGARV